jgi:hypothetical protein
MVFRCACQLTDYKIMDMIRASAARPILAERATTLDQPGTLVIRKFCIFSAYPGHSYIHIYILLCVYAPAWPS